MNVSTNRYLHKWRIATLCVFFSFMLLNNNKAKAQLNDFVCHSGEEPLDSAAKMAFVSSTNGGIFTPKGELRVLLIFAGFTNDGNKQGGYNPHTQNLDTSVNWPYYDLNGDSLNTFPTNMNDYFYTNVNQFSLANTDNSISNYYYQMSYPNGDPLKLVADVFPERINVTADIAIDTSGFGFYNYYNKWVLDSIAVKYPNFDWSPYDNR